MRFLVRSFLLVFIIILCGLTMYFVNLREKESSAYLISFASTRTGVSQIYIMTANGTDVHRLTDLDKISYGWYPNGPRWNFEHGCIMFSYGRQRPCVNFSGEISMLPLPELSPELKYGERLNQVEHHYVTSADSKWMIFSGRDQGLYRINPDGSDLLRISLQSARTIHFIEQLEYVMFNNAQGWYIVSINGLNEQYLTDYTTPSYYQAISPNKQWFVFNINPQGDYQGSRNIFNIRTGQSHALNFNAGILSWSPDSQWLAYMEDNILYVYNQSQDQTYPLSSIQRIPHTVNPTGVIWSPSSNALSLYSAHHIHVIYFDSGQITNISDHPLTKHSTVANNYTYDFMNHNAQWSPDGEWIVFQSELQYGTSDIYRVRPDGTDMQNLTNNPNWDVEPSWLPPIEKAWHPDYLLGGGLGVLSVGMLLLQISKKMPAYQRSLASRHLKEWDG